MEWAWLIGLAAGAPWIVGIVYLWRRAPRDGTVPPSLAEEARRRLWTTAGRPYSRPRAFTRSEQ